VAAALVQIGERLEGTYHLNTQVSSIATSADRKRVIYVLLSSDETFYVHVVAVIADLVYAYNLFSTASTSKARSSYAQSLSNRKGSCSSVSFCLQATIYPIRALLLYQRTTAGRRLHRSTRSLRRRQLVLVGHLPKARTSQTPLETGPP
jgi:hypothetical protein